MDKTRRKLLLTGGVVGAVALSGCVRRAAVVARGIREVFNDKEGDGSEPNSPDGVEPDTVDRTVSDSAADIPAGLINTDIQIEPGSVHYWEFTDLDSTDNSTYTLEYDVIVRSGPKVNIYFMDHDELGSYLNYENFRYYDEKSTQNSINAEIDTEIRTQDYAFAVENTSAEETTDVHVELSIV